MKERGKPAGSDDSLDDGLYGMVAHAVPPIALTDWPTWPELLRYSRYS
jgi:hypothetical protein